MRSRVTNIRYFSITTNITADKRLSESSAGQNRCLPNLLHAPLQPCTDGRKGESARLPLRQNAAYRQASAAALSAARRTEPIVRPQHKRSNAAGHRKKILLLGTSIN